MNRKNNQSISLKAEQLIRNYQIFVAGNKKEVLDTLLKKIETNEQYKTKTKHSINWVKLSGISVAATIALLISLWFFTASVTISSGPGATITHRLPDDSRVVLHNESSIIYNKNLWRRVVKLKGEAYFEIAKGEGFIVKTPMGEVEVLGTRFLVDARDNQFKVQCFQGKVKADYNKNSWILEQGMQFTGRNEKGQSEKIESEQAYPVFAMFNKNFSNTPLSIVIKEIETFFEVDIILNVPPGKNFSGNLQTGKLENVLQIVCTPLQLNYRIENEHLISIY